jgi:hypothetical protein
MNQGQTCAKVLLTCRGYRERGEDLSRIITKESEKMQSQFR